VCRVIHEHGFTPGCAEALWYEPCTEVLIRYRGFGLREDHRALQENVRALLAEAAREAHLTDFKLFCFQDNNF
jgi:hypothetical protein